MKEPDWNKVKESTKVPERLDVVWVTKKTRGRFGKMEVAVPGDHGLVISTWTSRMGSHKLCFVDSTGKEKATTASCVKVWLSHSSGEVKEEWKRVHLQWMEENYMPIIVVRKQRVYKGKKTYVMSRNMQSMLVTTPGSDIQIWLGKDKVHPDDWDDIIESNDPCHSVRVPVWLAKKGVLNGGKR